MTALLALDEITAKYNLSPARESSMLHKKNIALTAGSSGGSGTQPVIITNWANIDWTDFVGCAHGFAYGLQFSVTKKGDCYNAIDSSLDAFDKMMALLPKSYDPTTWAD